MATPDLIMLLVAVGCGALAAGRCWEYCRRGGTHDQETRAVDAQRHADRAYALVRRAAANGRDELAYRLAAQAALAGLPDGADLTEWEHEILARREEDL